MMLRWINMENAWKRLLQMPASIKIVGISKFRFSAARDIDRSESQFGSILASCSYYSQVIVWKEGNQNEWSQAQVFN